MSRIELEVRRRFRPTLADEKTLQMQLARRYLTDEGHTGRSLYVLGSGAHLGMVETAELGGQERGEVKDER